jgi:2-polyprenyl-3-methyl-5-hydroxy-6-metoxy-1,4-benzoquinol methylase
VRPELNSDRGEVRIVSELRPSTFEDAAEWYDYASGDHFWFQWRLAVLRRLLDDLGVAIALPLRALDVGCGRGVLRSQLEEVSRWTVDGADLNLEALRAARPGRGTLHYYDVQEEREPLVDSYDVVTLCDVLEHVNEPGALLAATARHLKLGGVLLINVPALPVFYGSFDEAVGHLRRYTRKTLSRECEALPLEVLETRYWGLSMVPLLLLRKLGVRAPGSHRSVVQEGIAPPGDRTHAVLRGLMRAETAILRRPFLGSSILLAARRSGAPSR